MSTKPPFTIVPVREDLPTQEFQQLLKLQTDILSGVALDRDYEELLADICRLSEVIVPQSAGSIMLYNNERSALFVRSAPNIPEAAIAQLNGLVPGKHAGSCGTAVYRETPVYVTDTSTDVCWTDFKDFANDFGIGACWSMPIKIEGSDVIGSFALSSFEQRKPTDYQINVLQTSASLAAIVIRREREQRDLEQAALYDALTGLPNRRSLIRLLDTAIENGRLNNSFVSLLFLDLDRFKSINDSRGHETGDKVLKEVAKVIEDTVRKTDVLSRFGGDEFVLLLEDVSKDRAGEIAGQIINKLCEPVIVDSQAYTLTASVGISMWPDHAEDGNRLLRCADIAMYVSKEHGRNCYRFFDPAMGDRVSNNMQLAQALRIALKEKSLFLNYQPIYTASSREINTVEVLVRWNQEEVGMIPPDQFIPVAEEAGLIEDLGWQVMESAVRQCGMWRSAGLPPFNLAVNVSADQLTSTFVDRLLRLLAETGFPADALEIEITESVVMDKGTEAVDMLLDMQKLGIRIVMDDFGTGHSSLSQLKRLPISKLKIDRSFVSDLPEDASDAAITRTIIAMSKTLGLTVVAEGVETIEQEEFLIKEGCDLLQGYFFSRPLLDKDLEKLLEESSG